MGMIINAPPEQRRAFEHPVKMMTAASAPPAAVLQAMDALGIQVTHVYGLTEVYGPATVCAWQEAWDALPGPEQARLQARQGVRYPVLEGPRGHGPRDACSRCRATARRSARS